MLPQVINVTEISQSIAKAVRDICSGTNRFTLLHMSELLKGADTKKMKESGHNRSKYHAMLKDWSRTDVHRLLHKLVLDEYLKEELIFTRDIPQAYLKIGPKIEKLMKNEVSLSFSVHILASKVKKSSKKDENSTKQPSSGSSSGSSTATATSVPALSSDAQKQIKELEDKCHNDLLDVCQRISNQRNLSLVSIMNMQALKAMSEKMPATPEEMLQISHVTKANFEKYGQEFLAVTQQYAAEKLCLIQDIEDAEAANRIEDACSDGADLSDGNDDNTNWGALASQKSKSRRSWSSGGGGGGGSARKRRRKFTSKSPRRKRYFSKISSFFFVTHKALIIYFYV